MLRCLLFLIVLMSLMLSGCDSKTKEDLLSEGIDYSDKGNFRGAIVLYKNALEKDPNYIEARIHLGDAYLQSGKFPNAEKEFQKILRQDPSNKDIILKLATVYIRSHKATQAITLIEEHFSSTPMQVKVLELLGQAYAIKGEIKRSEEIFQKGISVDTENVQVKIGLARVYLVQDKKEEARKLLNEAILIDSKNIAALYLLAELESSDGHVEQALVLYEKLTTIDVNDMIAQFKVGILLLFEGDVDGASKRAEKIITVAPQRPEGPRLKGLIYYVNGEYQDASLALLNSLKIEPHPNSYFFLGLSYYSLQQYEQALSQFQRALDLNPEFVKARNFTAMTLLKQGRLDDSINECRKAISADSDNAFSHQIMGSAFLQKGMLDQGMAELDTALRLNPDLVGAYLQKGIVRLSQGDVKLGESDLVQALEVAPDTQAVRLLLVNHYLKQQNYSAAIQTLQEGLSGEAIDGLYYNILAGVYFSQIKEEEALAALRKGKLANPDYFTLYYNLASYNSNIGNYEAARQEYLAVLQRDSQQVRALLSLAALSGFMGEHDQVPEYLIKARGIGDEEAFISSVSYFMSQDEIEMALRTVQEGLSLHPDSTVLLEYKCKLLVRVGDVENAEIALTKLARIDSVKGSSLLVNYYLQSGKVEQAFSVANELIASEPEVAMGYLLLSGLQVRQQELSSALLTIDTGIAVVDDKARLEMQRGALYEKMGEDDKAEDVYSQINVSEPSYVPALFARAAIYHRQGDMRQAQGFYRQVLSVSPDYGPALNNMAYLLTDNFGQSQEALSMALKAYRQNPSDPYVMDTLGYVLIVNNKAQDALSVLEKAVELRPENSDINLHLGMAYSHVGKTQKAQPHLQMVINKGQPELVKKARQLLRD